MSDALKAAASPRSSSAPAALADRVQSLRLPTPARTSGFAWFPWLLASLFLAATAYFALGGTVPGLPRPLEANKTISPGSATAGSVSAAPTTNGENPNGGSGAISKPADRSVPAATSKIAHESKGYIIPEQQILVSPQVSGRVMELNFEAGQQVERGFVLAVLDSTEYQAEFQRATAQMEAARERMIEAKEGSRPDEIRVSKAELEEAKTQLDQTKRVFDRRKELYQQKIVTPQDLDEAESQYLAQVRRVERLSAATQLIIEGPRSERKRALEAELRAATAELTRAKWRLDNTVITAPISGTVLKKNAELGNLVNPVAFNGSFSLCDIADLSKLEVELSIQERDVSKVFQHQKCRIRSEAFPDRAYDGYVSRLMPIADRAKGAVPVRVRVFVPAEEQGQYLKPEMGATVTFLQEKVEPPPAVEK